MKIIDHISQEAAALRKQGDEAVAAAQVKKGQLDAQATNLEEKIKGLPEELANLSDEAGSKVWGWIKGLF